jgi:hypothetical protein
MKELNKKFDINAKRKIKEEDFFSGSFELIHFYQKFNGTSSTIKKGIPIYFQIFKASEKTSSQLFEL